MTPKTYRVRIDEAGNVFDMDGEPVKTGMSPERILKVLVEIRAGRYRPIEDILAERRSEFRLDAESLTEDQVAAMEEAAEANDASVARCGYPLTLFGLPIEINGASVDQLPTLHPQPRKDLR